MCAELPDWLDRALSSPRFARYSKVANGDFDIAFRLYQWNLEVCSAFYTPLHWLEVVLRNALHDTLREHYDRDDWWEAAPLDENGRRNVGKARKALTGEANRKSPAGPTAPCADDIVAKLTFGFWVSLLSRGRAYDRRLWVPALHEAFPNYSGPRRPLYQELEKMRLLRNRIMHYEPVFEYDLDTYRTGIYRQLGYFSSDLIEWIRPSDRVPEVLARYEGIWYGDGPTEQE